MNEDGTPPASGAYVLGHDDVELRRLTTQARLIDPITRRFLTDGGIAAGMRVLDVGSGAGHVAFLAAELVGDSGEIVGVDRSAAAVEAAQNEAQARSLGNVSFIEGDPAQMVFDMPFDALVGRYVLQFQADPSDVLRRLAGHVRPGGRVVFHELDWGGLWSVPPAPTHDRCCGWVVETLRLSGAQTSMGLNLHATFVAAGLADPSLSLEAIIGGGAQAVVAVRQVVDLVGTLAPAMQRLGVASAAEIGYDTLFDRMMDETRTLRCVIVGRLQIGCWSATS
jgi:SAM-dependent methyltransferase